MVAGWPRAPHALAARADQALLLEVADDLAGGVVGQARVSGEIGLGRLAEAAQQGQDHALVVLADLHRVAALTRGAVAQRSTSPSWTLPARGRRHGGRICHGKAGRQ